ncbi:MAG TPA: CCA tRNA nucleotidyltransferase [bacterium]|nr:CCA tRNA nucleotidyltransferase [bacterium]
MKEVLDKQEPKENPETQYIGNIVEVFDRMLKKTEIPNGVEEIIKAFNKNGVEIFIPGGFVRDVLLNKTPNDIDFATNLNPDEIINLLEKELVGKYKKLELQGKTFGVIRIVMTTGENYEIATFRKDGNYSDGIHPDDVSLVDDIQEDVKRRDFTINALFYNPITGNIIDYTGGLEDLENKKLKFVGEPEKRIEEDKSRIIRYVRLLLQTEFTGDKLSEDAIINNSYKINIIPKELLKKELDKIIQISNPEKFIKILDELNLLELVFPDIKELENCAGGPPYHMEGNTLLHTLLVCKNLKQNADPILKWSALFHDIGKIETRRVEIKNKKEKVSFINHDKIGAEKTLKILKKMKFSKYDRDKISWLVGNHLNLFMQISSFITNNSEKIAKDKSIKAIKKTIRRVGEEQVLRLINLAQADTNACIYEDEGAHIKDFDYIFELFDIAKSELNEENKKGIDIKKIVNGKIIMQELKLNSGKKIGEIKNQIIEELFEQNFESKERAEEEFLKILKKFKN